MIPVIYRSVLLCQTGETGKDTEQNITIRFFRKTPYAHSPPIVTTR